MLHKHSLADELACVLFDDDRPRPTVEPAPVEVAPTEEPPPAPQANGRPRRRRKSKPTLPMGARRSRQNIELVLEVLAADQPMTATELRLRLARRGFERPLSQVLCMLQRVLGTRVKRTQIEREPGLGARFVWEVVG